MSLRIWFGKHISLLLVMLMAALSIPSLAWADGPTGLGPFQLGAPRQAIEAAAQTGELRLVSKLDLNVMNMWSSYNPMGVEMLPKGVEEFTAKVQTPWAASPVPISLQFWQDRLISLKINFTDPAGTAALAQMVSKQFGPGTVTSRMGTMTCKTDKDPVGKDNTVWKKSGSNNRSITTEIGHLIINNCGTMFIETHVFLIKLVQET